MIVAREAARLIAQGRKTEIRIPAIGDTPPCLPGRAYAIQVVVDRGEQELYGFASVSVVTGRTRRRRATKRETVGHALVVAVERQRLGDIRYESARAEGYRTTDDFYAAWRQEHRLDDIDPDQPVWVLTLAADVRDHPRLLHRRSEVGYTTKLSLALVDEPEAVDRETLERFAGEAEPENARRRELRAVEAREEHAAARRDRVTRIKARVRGGEIDGEAAA